MVKPRGKIERHGYRQSVRGYPIAPEGLQIAAWCPDDQAKLPPEQVHLVIPFGDVRFIVRFRSPDTLGFLIEELSRYRANVWPDSEPVEFETQFDDDVKRDGGE